MIDPTEFGKAMGAIVRVAVEPLQRRIDELEARQPERGEKGEPGTAGHDAEPLDGDAIAATITAALLSGDGLKTLVDLQVAESIAEHFEANPLQPGKDGQPGEKGDPGDRGEKGMDGTDGVGIAGALINRSHELVITTTKGEPVNLGVVVGKDGAPGRDGADGMGFDDLSAIYDGERGVVLKFQRGEAVKEFAFHLPVIIDRGYWREGTEAKAGDAMTHDGTLWIARCDTKAKPARESDDWRIGARKGRDGLQGPPGKAYAPPEPVKLT